MPQAEDYISLEGFISTPLDAALARILPDSYLGGSSGIGGWSARSTFQRCPYSYYRKFVSPLKANVIGGGERPSEALETGALFHLLLAFLYRYTYKKQEWPILVEVLRQRLLDDGVNGNVVNEAFRIFAAYRFRYEGEAIEPIAVEERAEYEGISCRYDLIAKLDGATWIIEHKCLPGTEHIVDFECGKVHSVADLHAQQIRPVVRAIDLDTGCLVDVRAEIPVPVGVRDVYELGFRSGRRLRCSDNHPLLTPVGWRPAAALRPGDWIAVPRHMSRRTDAQVSDAELKFVAYMLGDGSLSGMTFTKRHEGVLADFVAVTTELGDSAKVRRPDGRAPYAQMSQSKCSAPKQLLAALDVKGLSADKRIPLAYAALSIRQAKVFLGALWSTDGCVDIYKEQRRGHVYPKPRIAYVTRSRGLAYDVQRMLLVAGLPSTVNESSVLYKGARRPVWTVTIVTRLGKRAFLVDVVEGRIPFLRSQEQVREALAVIPTVELSRALPAEMPAWEVHWDRVNSVVITGRVLMYDLTVPDAGNFVVADVITHNTSSRADSATLEGWHNEGGVLGQLYLWKKLRLDRRFGPLAGLIVNITVKTKTVQFYRVQVPVTQARLTDHMRDLRVWEAYIGLSKATGNWPRNRASCVGRYGKCLLFQHCMGV